MSDDLDPADWLASQFEEEASDKPARRRRTPKAERPAKSSPVPPPAEPPVLPPAVLPPAAPPAVVPPASFPPVAEQPTPPTEPGPPAAAPGGFAWGLTPRTSAPPSAGPVPPSEPEDEPAVPIEPAWPVLPGWDTPTVASPVMPAAPLEPAALEPALPLEPAAPLLPPAPSEPLVTAWDTPTVASPVVPAAPVPVEPAPAPAPVEPAGWDTPTVASPTVPDEPAPTVALGAAELPRQEFPGFGVPVDRSIGGVTEAIGPQPVGLGAPEDEGVEVSAIDSLFGEGSFVEYEGGPVPVTAPRASGGELVVVDRRRPAEARETFTPAQKVLVGVAAGLVAVLLLIVVFLAGQRIAASAPAPAAPADPAASAPALPTGGPVPPGEYHWDQLRGGECLAPFASPWEDSFTVVDCAQPHPAQLVLKGEFPAAEDPAYPGVDELQKRAAALCTVPTVIDYAAAAGADDVQVLASFAANEQEWLDGNRTFYCFANRTGGAEFTASVAVQAPAS